MVKNRFRSFLFLTLTLLFISLISLVSINLVSAHSDNSTCQEEWVCSEWNDCRYGEKERECVDANHCGTRNDKPDEIKSCYSRYDYDDYYDGYYDHYYMMRDCSPRALYSPNHYCSRYFRDRQVYLDNYELELVNYYQSQAQENPATYQPQTQAPIQIQVTYPELDDEDRYEQNDKDYSILSNNPWFIIAIILGILSFIILIVIIIALIVRK
ncbi:hypothetical protein J4466_05310 [Candidatus Pacearchaeota archaeon]|nr:hypothetical protein [Candidatus Pacearchaeota archaeon]